MPSFDVVSELDKHEVTNAVENAVKELDRRYDALSAKVLAYPGLVPAPQERGEPYRFYNVAGGGEAFVLTQPGAPGHPAVFKQEAVQENGRKVMKNTGCAYGDEAGFGQVMAYLEGLGAR